MMAKQTHLKGTNISKCLSRRPWPRALGVSPLGCCCAITAYGILGRCP